MTGPVTDYPSYDTSEDDEFAAAWEKALETLSGADHDAPVFAPIRERMEITGEDFEEAARQIIADKMVKKGGKTFPFASAVSEWPADTDDDPMPEEQAPRTLVIPKPAKTPIWWDDPKQAEFLDHFITTRRALGNEFVGGLLITGPAGSGKSTSIPMATRRLGLPLFKMDCATVTDPQKWFGRREVDAAGTHYVKSDFVAAMESGTVILLDEISRLHPHLHNPVMAFLDPSAEVNLSDLNVTIHRHPETVIIATMNQGVQFGGTHRMDWAFRERFPYTIERDFPPADVEAEILMSHTGCDPDGAANLVFIADKSRQLYAAGDIKAPISTRTLVSAAWLVAAGMTEREALEFTAIPTYDPSANGLSGDSSERQTIRGAVEAKFGRGR